MNSETEEILRTLASLELDLYARIDELDQKLDRALVLLHRIDLDMGKPTEPTR